jgi:hypothetical protein
MHPLQWLLLLLWLYSPLLDLSRFFCFLILYKVCRTPWTGNQPVARPLPTHRTIQTQNKRTQSMLWFGFESTIPVFERAKTFPALDQWFSTFVRPRPGKFFFYKKRARYRAAARLLRNTALDRAATAMGLSLVTVFINVSDNLWCPYLDYGIYYFTQLVIINIQNPSL